jgi:CheY-like chemotaxis protein
VTTVATGDDAMNLLRSGRRFDAIVVDLWMPGRSGQELYEEIKEWDETQSERVIFTTGGGLPPKLREFADRRRTLLKPFTAEELFDALASVVAAA